MSNAKGGPIEGESIGCGCGKLYLTGEYAVMDVEGLAVIAGVDRYVTVRCRDADPSQPVSRVYSSYYGPQGRVIDIDAPNDIATQTISLVYRIAAGELENTPESPINIVIESDLDDADSGAKYGLGSSGAVAVAVTRALGAHLGLELDSLDVYKIAMAATLLAGAAGSGGDIACSAHGGVVLYRRPNPTALAELVAADPVAAVAAPWPNLRIDARADLGGLQLLVGWTGSPVKTDSQLKKAGGADRDFVRGVSSLSEKLWQALWQAGKEFGLQNIGLGARDTLRLEKGFCLYGNDIDDTTSPIEAGLGWITKFVDGKEFIDRAYMEKLKAEGVERKLVGFKMIDRGIPRHGYTIAAPDGTEIGRVTSGTMSPCMKIGFGMGYVKAAYAKPGTEIAVVVRDRLLKAEVVKLPFV